MILLRSNNKRRRPGNKNVTWNYDAQWSGCCLKMFIKKWKKTFFSPLFPSKRWPTLETIERDDKYPHDTLARVKQSQDMRHPQAKAAKFLLLGSAAVLVPRCVWAQLTTPNKYLQYECNPSSHECSRRMLGIRGLCLDVDDMIFLSAYCACKGSWFRCWCFS